MIPLDIATATAEARSPTASFRKIRRMWVLTVDSATKSIVAISAFDLPSATRRSTCRSRWDRSFRTVGLCTSEMRWGSDLG